MLTAKYVRAHNIPTATNGYAWFFRLLYEFWGFCVGGGPDLSAPGTGSFAPVSGVFGFPANFTTTGTLASGSDGFTADGQPFFGSLSPTAFSSSYVNQWLVAWKSGTTSTDDSVYQITQWINSSSIRLNVLHGATPYSGSLHPSMTVRSSINWRIVDFSAAAGLAGFSTSDSLVLQFSDAGNVNVGQANSQARLRRNTTSFNGVGVTLSPSGSWGVNSGSVGFTDAVTEQVTSWFNGSDSPAYISLWGAGDFLIVHYKGQTTSQGSGVHIEIPQRLYPQGVDPNPICVSNYGFTVPVLGSATTHYGGGFYMHNPPDNTTMQYFGMARRFDGVDLSTLVGATNGPLNGAYYNTYQNKFLFSDIILANPNNSGQYQLARARLRRVRALPPIIPQFERVGNNGEWLHVVNGVMWPWDNAVLPYNLFLGGN